MLEQTSRRKVRGTVESVAVHLIGSLVGGSHVGGLLVGERRDNLLEMTDPFLAVLVSTLQTTTVGSTRCGPLIDGGKVANGGSGVATDNLGTAGHLGVDRHVAVQLQTGKVRGGVAGSVKVGRVGSTESPVVRGGTDSEDVTEEGRDESLLDAKVGRLVLEPSVRSGTGVGEGNDGAVGKGINNHGPLLFHDDAVGTNPGSRVADGLGLDHVPQLDLSIPRPLGIQSVGHALRSTDHVDHRIVARNGTFLVQDEASADRSRVGLGDGERPGGAVGTLIHGDRVITHSKVHGPHVCEWTKGRGEVVVCGKTR